MIGNNTKFDGIENYYIDFANNDLFRASQDASNDGYIYDRQIDTAKEIVKKFLNKVTRRNHIILFSEMQSGKTGTLNATINIIHELNLERNMGIDRYMIITGMNDTYLKSQTYERLISQVKEANEENTYLTNKHSKRNTNKYYVLKNSDLMKYEEDINNTIIFIDESHYGSNEKNILTQFLYKNGVNWRDENSLISRNIYIVSISATPFAEVVSDTEFVKKSVILKNSDEYVGVSDYVKAGLVHNGKFEDTIDGIETILRDSLHRMAEDNIVGACIVRTQKFNAIHENDYITNNFDIYDIYCNGSKIQYERLYETMRGVLDLNNEDVPQSVKDTAKPILFLIKGAFRAGITLPSNFKDIIYCIYDYSVKSAATCQALLGRLCGYRPKDRVLRTHFYINSEKAEMYSKWSDNDFDRSLTPCDKTEKSWVETKDLIDAETKIASKSCGNFKISLSDEEIENLYKETRGKKTGRKYMMSIFPSLLEKHGIHIDYDYFGEAHMSGKNNYKNSSQIKRFLNFSDSSLVFPFRPEKIAEFDRDELLPCDFGKRCINVVLDANIDAESGKVIGGNKDLLVYYVEVGAYKVIPSIMSMYQNFKDTNLDVKLKSYKQKN